MKITVLKIIPLFLIMVGYASAQTPTGCPISSHIYLEGDFRSKPGTHAWSLAGSWEQYNGTIWVPTSNYPNSSTTAIVYIADTITIVGTTIVKNLVIQDGGLLKNATGTIRTVRVNEGSITVDEGGTFGQTTSPITIEATDNSTTMYINGRGDYYVQHFRPLEAVGALTININAILNVYGSFLAWYNNSSTNQDNNDITFNINAGATVVLAGASSLFIGTANNNTATSYGKYTFNISGTVDLTAMNGKLQLAPNRTKSTSLLAVNIKDSGILKLGAGGLRTVNATPGVSEGNSKVKIEAGGLIDATAVADGFIVTDANITRPIVISRKGTISGTATTGVEITFPVSTGTTTYNPVTINNSGSSRVFTLTGLKNNLDNSPTNPYVNNQWTITPLTAPDGTVSVGLGWTVTDQGSGFDPSDTVSLIYYDGSSWISSASSVTGSGTLTEPYIATATISNYGVFGIMNGTDVLPLNLVSFKAEPSTGLSRSVKLDWITENEKNIDKFIIESGTGKSLFTSIGSIPAKNVNGTHYYTFTDEPSTSGTIYYRLKQVDHDGKYSYSSPQSVIKRELSEISVYPNPSRNKLAITHSVTNEGASANIYSNDGRKMASFILEKGVVHSEIDISALAPGFYTLVFLNRLEKKAVNFIKE